MKSVEFRCSDPTPAVFFKEFIDTCKDDLNHICRRNSLELTGLISHKVLMEVYRVLRWERVRFEKIGVTVEIIRVEVSIIEDRKLRIPIRSLDSRGEPLIPDDANCPILFFPGDALRQN